ncbi:MAG: UDP-3-O-(3-hydroxymyristoyl)glucosamine N-acyltransferase [Myxococcota bacterium]
MRVGDLAQQLGGRLLGEDGDVHAVCSLESAQQGDLAAVLHPKELQPALSTQAGCLLLDESYAAHYADRISCSLIALANPFVGFAQALNLLHPPAESPMAGVHASCVVHAQAQLGQRVYAGPMCCIGQASIGDDSRVLPFVFIDDDVVVGKRCILGVGCVLLRGTRLQDDVVIHAGAVLGSDGFVYAPHSQGTGNMKVPCRRGVVVERGAEIGAGACVDRGMLQHTRLGAGVKIDNLVQIAHDVSLGDDTLIAAQSGVAGHSHLGKAVLVGGQAGVRERVHVGEHACVSAQSGVAQDVPAGEAVAGSPAMPQATFLRSSLLYRRLGRLANQVKQLSDKVNGPNGPIER